MSWSCSENQEGQFLLRPPPLPFPENEESQCAVLLLPAVSRPVPEGGGGRERASVTTFAGPVRYLRSEVNSAMAARWCCCLAEQGSETCVSAVTNGLQSVQSWKIHPSRMCLECLMVGTAARSSRSNIEYFDSASCSLRE